MSTQKIEDQLALKKLFLINKKLYFNKNKIKI